MNENERQTDSQMVELYHDLDWFSDENVMSNNFNISLNLEVKSGSEFKMPDYEANHLDSNVQNQNLDSLSPNLHSRSDEDYRPLSEQNDYSHRYSLLNEKLNLEETKFFSSDHIMFDYDLSLNENHINNENKLPNNYPNEKMESQITKKRYISKKRRENPVKKLIRLIENEKIDPYTQTEYLNQFITQEQIHEEKEEQQLKSFPKFITLTNTNINLLKPCCACQKSYCIKIYCSCFKNRKLCLNCNCKGCLNRHNFSYIRSQTIKHLEWKYDIPIVPKSHSLSDKDLKKSKGCNCKQSNCLKNYCICHQNGKTCSEECKCTNCLNV